MNATESLIKIYPLQSRLRWLFLIAFWIGLQAWGVLREVHFPSTDVFLFKEAGANFALTGKFTAKNLPNLTPDTESVFSYYPPVYPFLYGVFSRLVGIGLKQSLIFDGLIRIARTVVLFLFLWPLLRRSSSPVQLGVVVALGVLSFLSSDGDRPDELALVFGLLSWFLLQRGSKIAWAGFCLGLCGATSPAAGCFFGLGAVLFFLRRQGGWKALISLGLTSLVVFAMCTLPVQLSDSGSLGRFSKQVPFSVFPFLAPLRDGKGWEDVVREFRFDITHWWLVAGEYLFCVFVLSWRALVLLFDHPSRIRKNYGLWIKVAFLFVPLCMFVWTLQPYYLWFSCITLVVGVLVLCLLDRTASRLRWAFMGIAVAFFPLMLRESKTIINAIERPTGDTSRNVRETLLPFIGEKERIAVSPDQYFTFKGYREVANISYVCSRLDQYDYLYVTRFISSKKGIVSSDQPVSIPCETKQNCFTPVVNLMSQQSFSILGYDTAYYLRTHGGVLYKNTQCRSSLKT